MQITIGYFGANSFVVPALSLYFHRLIIVRNVDYYVNASQKRYAFLYIAGNVSYLELKIKLLVTGR